MSRSRTLGVIPGPEVPLFTFAMLVGEFTHRLLPPENIAQTIRFRYRGNTTAHKPNRNFLRTSA